jgi:hypothetical protein
MKPSDQEVGGTLQGTDRPDRSKQGRVRRIHGPASVRDVIGRAPGTNAPSPSEIFLAQASRGSGRS